MMLQSVDVLTSVYLIVSESVGHVDDVLLCELNVFK